MKQIFKLMLALMLMLALLFTLSPRAQAQPFILENDGWVTQTNAGTTLATVMFAANPYDGPRLIYVSATSDLAGSVLSIQAGRTEATVISNSPAAAVTIFVTDSSQFVANDVVLLQTKTNSVQRGIVSAIVNATNITLSTAFAGQAASIGDTIHKLGPAVTLPVGAATLNLDAEGIITARRARPLVLTLNGTSACKINAATVRYDTQ